MEKDIDRLIVAYLRKEISVDELDRLNAWLDEQESHRKLFRELCDRESVQREVELYASFDTGQAWQNLQLEMERTVCRTKMVRYWRAFAAVALLMIGVGGAWIFRETEPAVFVAKQQQVVPGGKHAVLVLEDGREIVLEGIKDTCIVLEKGGVLRVNGGEVLAYDLREGQGKPEKHILRTPRGGEYKITLDDGTEVWMNSASELSYPARFTGGERRVYLSGEAYFRVARNENMPFVVETEGMDVRVLGTVFNVMAYTGELKSVITLVEGKVEVLPADEQAEVMLQPGQQASLENGKMIVRRVNPRFAVSWTQGRFAFDSERLEEVMRKLARWYDIDFFFANPAMKQKSFTGSLPKYADISKVLDIIEMTTDVHFEMKGKRIEIR